MRLLHSTTLELHEFINPPQYAILSHTWAEEEVSFQELQSGNATSKKGFEKIRECCRIAAEDGFEYAWVDTCCIDKTSSAELSEAINSMFRWYQKAEVCYAFLSDVPSDEDPHLENSAFRRSRWFTRGWTLQELIAPLYLTFYGSDYTEIGTKVGLGLLVSEITKIQPVASLKGGSVTDYCVAQKMSWASRRVTTRVEDIAYCLMGIFDINMPMLYGEGDKAFIRLQEEIIKHYPEDHSILAWWDNPSMRWEGFSFARKGFLASSPQFFARSGPVRPGILQAINKYHKEAMSVVGNVLELQLPLFILNDRPNLQQAVVQQFRGPFSQKCFAMLRCIIFDENHPGLYQRFLLQCFPDPVEGTIYERLATDKIHYANELELLEVGPIPLRLMKSDSKRGQEREKSSTARDLWMRVEAFQKSPNITSISAAPLRKKDIPEQLVRGPLPLLVFGFRFERANNTSFDLMMKVSSNDQRDDTFVTTVIDAESGKSLGENVDDLAKPPLFFNSQTRDFIRIPDGSSQILSSDGVTELVPSLGLVTVKIRKVGRGWNASLQKADGWRYDVLKKFYFRMGCFEEEDAVAVPAEVTYLVDVKIE